MAGLPLLATEAARSGITGPAEDQAAATAQFVAAGKDRTHTPVAMGFSSLGFKVSGQDTHGAVFLMEHVGLTKGGGPPRHLHHEQEE
jgi:hypothetical protein